MYTYSIRIIMNGYPSLESGPMRDGFFTGLQKALLLYDICLYLAKIQGYDQTRKTPTYYIIWTRVKSQSIIITL